MQPRQTNPYRNIQIIFRFVNEMRNEKQKKYISRKKRLTAKQQNAAFVSSKKGNLLKSTLSPLLNTRLRVCMAT